MHAYLLSIIALLLALTLSACSSKPAPLKSAQGEPGGKGALALSEEGELEGALEGALEEALDPDLKKDTPPETRTAAAPVVPEVVPMPEETSPVSAEDWALLDKLGWTERVGKSPGVWVNVERQAFYIINGKQDIWEVPCATATAGTGSESGSEKTPLGWHEVSETFGADAPWGQVFRSRGATPEVWQPGGDTKEDLVLTRILWLAGLEAGKNQGKNDAGVTVDSKQRYIYIHGTNGETMVGVPSSHGCIRLRNDDVITAFERLPVRTPVLITENGAT